MKLLLLAIFNLRIDLALEKSISPPFLMPTHSVRVLEGLRKPTS